MHILYTILFTIIINIPFGYLRANQPKFSLLWFIYIHAPVPFIAMVRHLLDVNFTWKIAPLLLGGYFVGQLIGKKLKQRKFGCCKF